jgi:type II secretory pathway pseudopilin PulG
MIVKKRHLSAFSLIEIAIVLIILGLILGLTIPMTVSSQKVSQQKITQTHQEQIIIIGRLCPSIFKIPWGS